MLAVKLPGFQNLFRLILLWLIPTVVSAAAPPIQLIETRNLNSDAALARQANIPIVLLVSQQHCPFCSQIKQEILGPMIIAGDYRGQILIREIFIDPGIQVIDFEGKEAAARNFARGYGVNLTPTLLFLGPDGRELSERILGFQMPDMFFYYVDQSIKKAIAALTRPQVNNG